MVTRRIGSKCRMAKLYDLLAELEPGECGTFERHPADTSRITISPGIKYSAEYWRKQLAANKQYHWDADDWSRAEDPFPWGRGRRR